uniref:Threonylcarbamoyl-AMP synthase n=1 Tax=Mesocestoides corti TaxID=53468 RepID=A0A5K3FJ30_MESCO
GIPFTKAASLPQWCDTQGISNDLLSTLLPGPVTVLLPRLPEDPLCPLLNPGVAEIGIRVPDSPLVCRLSAALATVLREEGLITIDDLYFHPSMKDKGYASVTAIPLVLTSANPSGYQSTLSPDEFSCLWPELDLVLDGGRIGGEAGDDQLHRAASTVVDLSPTVRQSDTSAQSTRPYRILREGR